MGYDKNMSFLMIPKSLKWWKKVEQIRLRSFKTLSINTLPSTQTCNVHIQPYTHRLDWWDRPSWHVLAVKTPVRFVLLRPLQDILLLLLLTESHTYKDKHWQVSCRRWVVESCKCDKLQSWRKGLNSLGSAELVIQRRLWYTSFDDKSIWIHVRVL